jgi:hypothetical protein
MGKQLGLVRTGVRTERALVELPTPTCAVDLCHVQLQFAGLNASKLARCIDAVSFECGDTVCVEVVYCCKETVLANFTFVRLPVLSVCSANIFFLALRVVHDRAGPVSVVAELSKFVQHQ